MIPPHARLTVEWVPLDAIIFDDQPIDPAQVTFWATLYQGTDSHCAPPILNDDLTIRDGRHRLLAHRATGRPAARCLVVRR